MSMRRMLAVLVITLSVATSPPAMAAAQERTYTHVLADTETRLDARRVAVQELQRQAAAEAASFVQGETRLDGERLTQSLLEVVSATVSVTVLEELPEVVGGRPALRVRARTEVDPEVVKRRLELLRSDTRLRQQLEQLAIENARLEGEIARLRLARESSLDSRTMEHQERAVRARLAQGRVQAAALFVSTAPALSQAAMAHAIASEAFASFEARFEEELVTRLTALPIKAALERVTIDVDPRFLRGSVVVQWKADLLGLTVCEQIDCGTMSMGYYADVYPIAIRKSMTYLPRAPQLDDPNSPSRMFRTLVARYLNSFDLVAVVTAADQMVVLPVLTSATSSHVDALTNHLEHLESETSEYDRGPPSWYIAKLHRRVSHDIPVRFPADHQGPISVRMMRLPRPCDEKVPECNAFRNFSRPLRFETINTLKKPKSSW